MRHENVPDSSSVAPTTNSGPPSTRLTGTRANSAVADLFPSRFVVARTLEHPMSFLCLSPSTGTSTPASASQSPIEIAPLTEADLPAVERLHDTVFGPGRFARTAYRIREGAPALSPACCKLTINSVLKGAVQMTWITVGTGGVRGMLLGPLAVCQTHASVGHGQALIAAAVEAAQHCSAAYVILVGDLLYYEKTGFERVPVNRITLPGPVDPMRLLIRRLHVGCTMPEGDLRSVAPDEV